MRSRSPRTPLTTASDCPETCRCRSPDRLHEVVARTPSPRFRRGPARCCSPSRCSRAPVRRVSLPRSTPPGRVVAALAEARDADVVVDSEAGVRFVHPLLASAVYTSVSEEQRRGMRQRLADVVSDREERAKHAARAATAPDEATASEVERAAELASRRGAARCCGGSLCTLPPASLRPNDRATRAVVCSERRTRRLLRATRQAHAPSPSRRANRASDARDVRRGVVAPWRDCLGGDPRPGADRVPGTRARTGRRMTAGFGAESTHCWPSTPSIDHARVLEHSDAAVDLLDETQGPRRCSRGLS